MELLRPFATQLNWSINDSSLDDEGVTFNGHPITPADLTLLNQPINLETPNLVLHLLLADRFAGDHAVYNYVTFPTGPVVTPLQILGAIYTYYDLPLTEADLDELKGAGMDELVNTTRRMIQRGLTVPRSDIMGNVLFQGISEYPDGSFLVIL